jgi:Na+-transporting methylmalonyl-CoA/oxaloacetate decarboxylase gamma subunit
MIVLILLIAILAFVGKLIYDVQQNKNKINETNETAITEAEKFREQWQTIAGIKPHNKEAAPFNPHNNKLNENIIDELKSDFQNSKFPPEDQSINVITQKITTIDMKSYGDSDPLATIPMSRVSKEGKKKMAEIAKEDISKQLEEKTANIHPNDLNTLQMVLGDLGKMNDSADTKGSTEIINAMINAPLVKPKRKYNKKPKK